jgi:hypothetical protein
VPRCFWIPALNWKCLQDAMYLATMSVELSEPACPLCDRFAQECCSLHEQGLNSRPLLNFFPVLPCQFSLSIPLFTYLYQNFIPKDTSFWIFFSF